MLLSAIKMKVFLSQHQHSELHHYHWLQMRKHIKIPFIPEEPAQNSMQRPAMTQGDITVCEKLSLKQKTMISPLVSLWKCKDNLQGALAKQFPYTEKQSEDTTQLRVNLIPLVCTGVAAGGRYLSRYFIVIVQRLHYDQHVTLQIWK